MEIYELMGNKNQENKINVDELLKRKRERNAKNKQIVSNNYRARNEAIARRHEANTEELLLGEAQIDLQNRLLDAEDRAAIRFNDNYNAMTARVIESNDAKADLEAERINSAIDVEFQILEEVKEVEDLLPSRRSRFSNTLLGSSEEEETFYLQSSSEELSKSNRFKDNLPEL